MNRVRPKQRPVRLNADSYSSLRQQVLQRDGWRCQNCGRSAQLEVHHLRFRSHSGEDDEGNLITLCAECHQRAHSTGPKVA